MSVGPLFCPMLTHVAWTVLLYALLTIVRAPTVWGIGSNPDKTNPFENLEPRVSANLSNQFEWPLLFYVVCVLAIVNEQSGDPVYVGLAWLFIGGRIIHSAVQIFSTNIRLRGIVFTINFVAVLGMWAYMGFGTP